MKKRILGIMIMVVVSMGCIAGCGAATTKDAGTNADTAVSESDKKENKSSEETVFSDETLNIYVAASLKDAITEIIDIYNKNQPNVKININADSSGTLQSQIEEAKGTDVDMFFSASKKQMKKLQEEGYIEENTVSDLLKNEVVLISAKRSGTKVKGFENITDAESFALAEESVPVGQYSRQIFEKLRITDAVNSMEINQCDNVSAVKNAVAEGSNEIGTVYYSDYYSVKDKVDLIAKADDSWCDPIVYPVGLVINPEADDNQKAAIKDFYEFLKSDEVKAIFEKYMFVVNE